MATGMSARLLAPMALAACATGVLLILLAGGGGGGDTSVSSGGGSSSSSVKPVHTKVIVHTGDTLTAIAVRNHVTVKRIVELNPQIDPGNIRKGQRLKLVP